MNGVQADQHRSLLFPIRFPQSHKKGQPYGCPFLWPPIHLPAKEKEEERRKKKEKQKA